MDRSDSSRGRIISVPCVETGVLPAFMCDEVYIGNVVFAC
jgi:hypothetical protein